MRVIGTAGHVDHGKSTLIETITGIHPDRLQEERDREMTIVLGFAWFTLPNGEEIGIVDVPGHRDFIGNMLSGIGAIDAALFVVAADEGVMPQTLEHLAILDLLRIDGGVVALTKIDLIDDPEWMDLVEFDLKETLSGTVLENAPILRVSAKTGEGVVELINILGGILSERSPRADLSRPRLAIDRVFTMAGFGTIVTGTLLDGQLTTGEEVVILPKGLRGRIRGLQTHKRKEQTANPGSRTAVNISGIDVAQIQRGDVVVYPGDYQPTRRLDVEFHLLPETSHPLRHNSEVKLYLGSSEVIARVRLLGKDILKPGEDGWIQLELQKPVLGVRGDRYILRRPSPGETWGGGFILDPQPQGRHKRFGPDLLDRLEALGRGDPKDILLQAFHSLGVTTKNEILSRSNLDQETANSVFEDLLNKDEIINLDPEQGSNRVNPFVVSNVFWKQFTDRAIDEIKSYNKHFPLRIGMPREEFKSRLNVSSKVFNATIKHWISEGVFEETSARQNLPGVPIVPVIHTPGYQISLSQEQQNSVNRLLERFVQNPYSPPSIKDANEEVGDDLVNAMIDLGYLIPISSDVVFRYEDYHKFVDQIIEMLNNNGTLTVAQVRDAFHTSRRYVLAILEHLDSIGVTIRSGDVRKLK